MTFHACVQDQLHELEVQAHWDSEVDAFTELVRMGVAASPNLALRAPRTGRQNTASSIAGCAQTCVLQADCLGRGPRCCGCCRCTGPGVLEAVGLQKPPWLRQRAPAGDRYNYLKDNLRGVRLATVCEEAQCPNLGECWNGDTGTATIMLLGGYSVACCNICGLQLN